MTLGDWNVVTLFMCGLGALMTIAGLGIVWLGITTVVWPIIVIGLAWVAFAGSMSVYAWRVRREK